MAETIDMEKLAEEVIKCKLQAWNKIDEILEHIGCESVRVDELEAAVSTIKNSLNRHEMQRVTFNEEIKSEMNELKEWFKRHDGAEMEKFDKILVSINSLTEALNNVKIDTDDNSKALMQKRIEEEKQRAVDEAVKAVTDAHDAPYQEYKKKAIMTLIGIVTTAMVIGLWKMTMFITNLDKVQGV